MRVFYTSPYGIGIRDIIDHGLRSDKGLQSADSLAVWWFTLHLVCLFSPELHKRNYEQNKRSKSSAFSESISQSMYGGPKTDHHFHHSFHQSTMVDK